MSPVERPVHQPIYLTELENGRVGPKEGDKGIKHHSFLTAVFLDFLSFFGITRGTYTIKDEGGNVYYLNRRDLDIWLERNRDPETRFDNESTKLHKTVENQRVFDRMGDHKYIEKLVLSTSHRIELNHKIARLSEDLDPVTSGTIMAKAAKINRFYEGEKQISELEKLASKLEDLQEPYEDWLKDYTKKVLG